MKLKSDTRKKGLAGLNGIVDHSQETLDLKELLNVLSRVKNGKLSTRMPVKQARAEK